MSRIRWRTVAAWFTATLASGWLPGVAVMHPFVQPESSSTEYKLIAIPAAYFLLLVGEAEVLSALLIACLLGGVVTGRLSPSAPGANGTTAAAVFGALAGISWLLLAVPPFAALPSMVSFVNPVSRSVDAGTLAFWAIAFVAFCLLALLAGYLGGMLGGRLRRPLGSEASRAG